MLENILIIISVLIACYLVLFIISVILKDNSIADVFWGLGFVIITFVSFFISENRSISQGVITALVTLWWMRLTYHIAKKKLSHSWEDARYAKWRNQWKYFYTRSLFQVYLFQGLLMCIIATPIFLVTLNLLLIENFILVIVWWCISVFGLVYEIIADIQLKKFMTIKNKWEILTAWLRKYHRYPQYFGESIFWLGISCLSLQVSLFGLIWWWVITFLLLYVSWVPLLEARYTWNKKYQEYSRDTPIFIPNFKK